jgi:ribosomal protein S18 acetylase RimI-like enzyme
MKPYRIVNTVVQDLHFIFNLFEDAICYQKRRGYPVWAGYDKEVLAKDIENKLQYKIIIDSRIACVFSICHSDEIIWRDRERGDSLYLHRIAVNDVYKGQRQFEKILNWAASYAAERKLSYVRMDTWEDNPDLVTYYKSFGFRVAGSLTTPDSTALPLQQRNNKVVLLEFSLKC